MGSRRRRIRKGTAKRNQRSAAALAPIAPGAPPFSPLNVSSCVLWLRADIGTTIATGVSAWADQSGTNDPNKNAVQGTGSAQPTFNVSDAAYNNKPTLSFASASSQTLVTGTWAKSLPQPFTAFVVGNDDGAATAQVYWGDNTSDATDVKSNAANYVFKAAASLTSAAAVSNAKRVLAVTANGGSSALRISAITPDVSGNTTSGTIQSLAVGSVSAGTFLNGKIAEVIIYSRALSVAEINALLAYCGSKYAITIGA